MKKRSLSDAAQLRLYFVVSVSCMVAVLILSLLSLKSVWEIVGDPDSLTPTALTTTSSSSSFARPFDPSDLEVWKQRRWQAQGHPGLEMLCKDPAAAFLQVAATNTTKRPKILCVILTQSNNHDTRLAAILQTWGYQCDRFVGASDQDDPTYYAYNITDAAPGYWGIYSKLMHTLRQILQDQIPFDWVFKGDDDTYVIMENLYAFLESQREHGSPPGGAPVPPIIYGRNMPWPTLKELHDNYWFRSTEEQEFRGRFFLKFPTLTENVVYVHGGPGYLMNRPYVEATVEAYFDSPDAIKGMISEDIAQSVNMMYRNILPRSTMDVKTGKERSHPESPRSMYENPDWLPNVQLNIQNVGNGQDCCSPSSISYHHMTPWEMLVLDYQLYACPKN
jgi:glycoprotein-N-acetylgalactosamine 3-beta-galactosyltransferase